jgi:hypothetical protein
MYQNFIFYKIQTCYWQFEVFQVIQQLRHFYKAGKQLNYPFNPLEDNGHYSGRTAQLISRICI